MIVIWHQIFMIDNNQSAQYRPQLTADGSFTFFSETFGETFHSDQGARLEAELKFVKPLQLEYLASQLDSIKILDVCYGLGYNTVAALTAIWQINPHCQIQLIALELDLQVPQQAIAHQLLDTWPSSIQALLKELIEKQTINSKNLQANLLLGDARQTLAQVKEKQFLADAIFLDPFSPKNCPQLWSLEFIGLLKQCLAPHGQIATYSCAASVRQAFLQNNFYIGPTLPVGRRSPGTIANLTGQGLSPLSAEEQEHLQTKAAIIYRDPHLSDNQEMIMARRQIEQQTSQLEPTSRWKKRWCQSHS
ncbi:MAG: tRNA (5-methylaminomethyl-2-thiouridine)(34)-methyltransferase MnmD [Microcoleaceae cyanobacterium]